MLSVNTYTWRNPEGTNFKKINSKDYKNIKDYKNRTDYKTSQDYKISKDYKNSEYNNPSVNSLNNKLIIIS